MTVASQPYVMKISRTTVDKLGIKLYDKASAVVSELIANSYDADAEIVTVKIPLNKWLAKKSKEGTITDQGLEISVEDDGHGMEPNVINDFYLKVGVNPRDDPRRGEFSLKKKRHKLGRKGIGKLAPFGICKLIEIRSAGGKKTSHGYLTSHFILNHDDVNTETDEAYMPMIGKDDRSYSKKMGTVIRLTNFLYRRTPDAETFLRQIARNFGMELPDFKIKIINTEDGKPYEIGKLDVQVEEETKIRVDDKPVEMDDGTRLPVSGYVAYAKRPYRHEEVAGVRIYARKKIVAVTRDFGLRAGFTGEHSVRSYSTGEVHADWLDDEEDLIHTGRQDILWDSERGEVFKKWGQALIRELGKKAWNPMRKKAIQIFMENSDLENEAKKRFSGSPQVAEAAIKLGKGIVQIASHEQLEDIEYVRKLSEIVLTSAPHKMLVDKLAELSEASSNSPLDVIISIFQDANLAETSSMGQIAIERVESIGNLEKRLGKNPSTKESELQTLLESAPWLINPEWTVLQANKSFENLRSAFERWYKSKKTPITTKPSESHDRPDFIMLPISGKVEIIEIKRAGHILVDKEFTKLVSYYYDMEDFMKENPIFRKEFPHTQIWLICDGVSLSRPNELALSELQNRNALSRSTWEELLAKTKNANQDFLELHRGFSK